MALWIFGDIVGWIGWIYLKLCILLLWIYYYIYLAIEWILRLLGNIPVIGALFNLLADFWEIQHEVIEISIDKLDDYADQWRDTWSEW